MHARFSNYREVVVVARDGTQTDRRTDGRTYSNAYCDHLVDGRKTVIGKNHSYSIKLHKRNHNGLHHSVSMSLVLPTLDIRSVFPYILFHIFTLCLDKIYFLSQAWLPVSRLPFIELNCN